MVGGQKVSVLMFPWLAHGHLSAFLDLAKRLAKRNFITHLCSSPANLTSIKGKIGHEFADVIQLVELHLPSLPDLPSHFHTTNGLPPHLMPLLHQAFAMAQSNFSSILQELKPDLLIHDYLPPWAPATARASNIPAVEYITTSTAFMAYSIHPLANPHVGFPFPSICYPDNHPFLMMMKSSWNSNEKNPVLDCLEKSSGLILAKTFPGIEREYMDYFSSMCNKKVLAVPVVQEPNPKGEKSEIIQWLEKKEKSSTVFVSFGSEYFLSREELEEVALGLELSGANFIWVVRFPAGEAADLPEVLPEGYVERVKSRGLVVQGWAPQGQILAHPSTGGFVSHCGWNSVMEGVKMGVPVIAAPMSIDQPINAKVLEEAGVGVEIARDEKWRLRREKIAEAIKQVVIEESGERVRRTAREMSGELESKGEEGIDVVAQELVRLSQL